MKAKSAAEALRVGLISLGCAKNLADAEIMLGSLLKAGMEITNDASQADVVIVNTCSFIDTAQQESVDVILESDQVRQANNRGQGLIVSGCLPQRFREELPKLLPEVDAFMGIDQVGQAPEIVRAALKRRKEKIVAEGNASARDISRAAQNKTSKSDTSRLVRLGQTEKPLESASTNSPLIDVNARPSYIPDYATPRFRLTPRHFAYLKIAEGCNHPCSFCIIPRMRGSHRSRGQNDILQEARQLIESGVKELNLISQDSTYYGLDLRTGPRSGISAPDKFRAAFKTLPSNATTICTLLRELNNLPGEFWIRLLYTHPAHWTEELIETIAACKKVARYIDIPLQHIHDNMLERMRRETSRQHVVDLLARIRAGIPGIALRTTFIVGFPGETEACFEQLLGFMREARFERLGVFTYSQEQGTRAGAMAGQIPDSLKRRRRERAMSLQKQIARGVAKSNLGRKLQVLVEGEASTEQLKTSQIQSWEHGFTRGGKQSAPQLNGRYFIGRSEADAPGIDGRVYVRGRLPAGQFAQVKIIGHTDYDLVAEPA